MNNLLKLKYGYSVTSYGDYFAVGNPSSFVLTSSLIFNKSSVQLYKYSKENDLYNPIFIFYNYLDGAQLDALLATDDTGPGSEYLNNDPDDNNFKLDVGPQSIVYLDDAFGTSVDLYSSSLAVGCPYIHYGLYEGSTIYTSSFVNIYDLNSYTGSYTSSNEYYPSYKITNSFDSESYSSFGESVSIYKNILAVGSSKAKNNSGSVYIFTQSFSTGNWLHFQTIEGPKDSYFGSTVKLDKSDNNSKFRLVVGNKSGGSIPVHVYEFENNNWILSDELYEDRTITGSVTYNDVPVYIPTSLYAISKSNFGSSVDIYDNFIVVGAPDDMYYYSYSGSNDLYRRGAVYFFTKCNENVKWSLFDKTFGTQDLLSTNKFGYSVSIHKDRALATSVADYSIFSACYIENTLNKAFSLNESDINFDTLGQAVVYQYNTSSSWVPITTLNKRKERGYPYNVFGYSTTINQSILGFGAPLFISDPLSLMFSDEETIQGYSYIYNFNDYFRDYLIGNVFYKNGKIILSNSGSIFDNVLKSTKNPLYPEYDITYKSNVKLYETQILCRIEPNEFNFSTNPTSLIRNIFDFDINKDNLFDFVDLDLILKHINYRIYQNYNWFDNIGADQKETLLYRYYVSNYELQSTAKYIDILNQVYDLFDLDGNGKVNVNDMKIFFKYFVNTLTVNDLFNLIEPKSSRKNIQSIVNYIEIKIGKNNDKKIKHDFFNTEYSSSIDTTGSYLSPYITTIGLYDGLDLIAVAKLATPVKTNGKLPLNFLVKWDT